MDNLNHTALLYASANGHKDIVQILVLNNANVNAKANGNYRDLIATTRIDHNDAGGVRFFDIHKTEKGRTALILAADKGYKEIVDILLENNADVNAKDNNGWTALILAAENGHKDIVIILLQNNANVNARSDSDVTALLAAVKNDYKPIVEILLHNRANINVKAKMFRWGYKTGYRIQSIVDTLHLHKMHSRYVGQFKSG